MKKTIALLIAISMIFALCACGSTAAEAPAEKAAEEAAAAPEATEKPETELEKLIREAGEGDVEAMMKLADMYLNGEDVEQDTRESISWYTKAAEAGNTEAMKNLGSYYLFAEDEKDPEKGLEWYTKAAETPKKDWNGSQRLPMQAIPKLCTCYPAHTNTAVSFLRTSRKQPNIPRKQPQPAMTMP